MPSPIITKIDINPSDMRFVSDNQKLKLEIVGENIRKFDVDPSISNYFFNLISLSKENASLLSLDSIASVFNDLLYNLEEKDVKIVINQNKAG